ncbi:MAG: primosomal protein N' [Ruminococcaceae bacterium]|nr:primosomal protein N' [Oscillospiraceae bacterium]
MQKYVNIYLLNSPYHIDKPYTYALPELPLSDEIKVGSLVAVPFGRGDRVSFGVAVGFSAPTEEIKIKPVLSVLDNRFSLSEEMLGLCLFLKEQTLCTVGEAVRAMTPAPVFSLGGARNIKKEKLYSLAVPKNEAAMLAGEKLSESESDEISEIKPLKSESHRKIIAYLLENGETGANILLDSLGVTGAQLSALCKKGIISYTERELIRNPYLKYEKELDNSEIVLNRAQAEAYDSLCSLYAEDKANAALLYGVTGSGKTKVIMKLLDRVLSEKKTAIMMVPEISLTPQTVSIFCRRYGSRVAVIHSSLGEGERFDMWRRIADGEVDLVIGTRSAVFAPLKNLGLIVIDEEHEHTYKSEANPKYHAKDVAAYRAGKNNALMLLASATPSLESFYKAKTGKYSLIELRYRYGGATLPETEIVDMRDELRAGNTSGISALLADELKETVEGGNQAILFLNRRGYHSHLHCRECGYVLTCPHCSISLTYHYSEAGGYLLCHSCGYREGVRRTCPECGSERISHLGIGTQKIEGELGSFLENAKITRMDADTTAGKQAYDAILGDFREHRSDILLGTQMVTKGHDFPLVTLVGVLLADTSLYMGDFRASEQTFSLLTQVIGRAGRSKSGGKAIIQTMSPNNDVIKLACRQDYDSFYEREIKLRKSLSFPPFCDIVQLTLTSENEEKLKASSEKLLSESVGLADREYKTQPMMIFGPFEAQTYKVSGKYRMRMVVKCRLNRDTREYFSRLLCMFATERDVSLSIDFNPVG